MKPIVVNDRFSLNNPNEYIMFGLWPKGAKGYALLNGRRLDVQLDAWKGYIPADRTDKEDEDSLESVSVKCKLPSDMSDAGTLDVIAENGGEALRWFSIRASRLKRKAKNPQAFIEMVERFSSSEAFVSGWVASQEKTEIEVLDMKGSPVIAQVTRNPRPDVQRAFAECEIDKNCGFKIVLKDNTSPYIRVEFKNALGSEKLEFPMGKAQVALKKAAADVEKGFSYLKNNGMAELLKKISGRYKKTDRPVEYMEWIRHNFPTYEELEKQKKERLSSEPLISIVVPLYKTKEKFLNELVASVKAQTYSNWELCLSDGSGQPSPIADKLDALAASDDRIRVIKADVQRRIVPNTNRAIEEAAGEYIAFLDHDDVIAPDAMYEIAKAICLYEPEFIYTDEDMIDETGGIYFDPKMKPDFNIDFLRSNNYICHMSVIKRILLDEIGMLNEDYEGSQDYDITLRAVEKTERIYHIPKVLYHWRSHEESTAGDPETKRYAFEAGKRAISDHLKRLGIAAEVCESEWYGLYRVKYKRPYDPLVSIVIPNKDHTEDLDRCVKAISERSTYKNLEFVIVENNSEEKETFEYYKEAEAKYPGFRVVYYDGKFNYSKINNFGVKNAKGEYLLLLNNDTEMINDDCIEEMLDYCMRADVGIVGARLYYEDDTIQHAGVVIGFGGIAGHCFVNQQRGVTGYCRRIVSAQDYSAVTAACMMVKRSVYEEVDGFYEELAVAFNDVDFCLKVRAAGYLVVYNPYAEMYHYESKSRGYEDTPEKVARFNQEKTTIESRWPEILKNGDPYYSPNLTLDSQDFSLKRNW